MDVMIELNEAELDAVAGGAFTFRSNSNFSASGQAGEATLSHTVTVTATSFNDTSSFSGSVAGSGE